VEVIKKTPLESGCCASTGGKYAAEEVFKLRLAHLIMTGTPVEAKACLEAWAKVYGSGPGCRDNCLPRFIRFATGRLSKMDKGLVIAAVSPPQKA